MKTVHQALYIVLDKILIPPLIEICCDFVTVPCNRQQLVLSRTRSWNTVSETQVRSVIQSRQLTMFEEHYATKEAGPAIPWVLLHYAIETNSWEIAHWLLEYGIDEYHPAAIAVLALLLQQKQYLFYHPDFSSQTIVVLHLLLAWQVPLIIPGTNRLIETLTCCDNFFKALSAYNPFDHPILTNVYLPSAFYNDCVEYCLAQKQWSLLLVVLEQFPKRRALYPAYDFELYQQFTRVREALPADLCPLHLKTRRSVWHYLNQQRFLPSNELSLPSHEDETGTHLVRTNLCNSSIEIETNARVGQYLQCHGFTEHRDVLWPSYDSNLPPFTRVRNRNRNQDQYQDQGSDQAQKQRVQAFRKLIPWLRMYYSKQSKLERLAPAVYQYQQAKQKVKSRSQNPDPNKLVRHQKPCIKNPVKIRQRWKTHQ